MTTTAQVRYEVEITSSDTAFGENSDNTSTLGYGPFTRAEVEECILEVEETSDFEWTGELTATFTERNYREDYYGNELPAVTWYVTLTAAE